RALIAFTASGDTARRVARLRSDLPLLVFTPSQEVRNQLALTWGAESYLTNEVSTTDEIMQEVDSILLGQAGFTREDAVVIVAGSPPGTEGNTNMIHVHLLGEDTA
ncbi:pyruvate kinase alpha/beta domain-containing protein, partial [Corynebacterium glyciniphilum]